jgi:alkylation response protein AidB-like acyl-CoA dehydrogenase
MRFELTAEEAAWQDAVRAYALPYVEAGLERVADERRFGHNAGNLSVLERRFYEDLGERGWNSLHWPKAFGGRETSATTSAILNFELEYQGLPELEWTVSTLAPVILQYGTHENVETWLEPIRRGEVMCALGYSESEAGTDLANLRTSAVRDGDTYVINGEKLWQSGAHYMTHAWLAARTDPKAPKHKGISIVMVPLDAPGVRIDPIWVWSGYRTNIVSFTDVVVPVTNRIGTENEGWKLITAALDFERAEVGARVMGRLRRLLDDLISYCRTTVRDGRVLIADREVRRQLAELEADVEIAGLLTHEVCGLVDKGQTPTVVGTMQKILASELRTKVTSVAFDLMDLEGQLDGRDPLAVLNGEFEKEYRDAPRQRFGGGTNEVLRDVIAQRGLGLPRSAR